MSITDFYDISSKKMSKDSNKFSIKRRLNAFVFAFEGFIFFFKSVHNAWIHLFAAILTVVAGFLYELNAIEWLWVLSAIAIVFITEMINTAIEKVVDLNTSEFHLLAKQAKDIAAAAVLTACVYAIVVALIIFIPKF